MVILWCSEYGIVKLLYSPVSMSKNPFPRIVFRLPDWPAIVSWNAPNAAFGSCHRFGDPWLEFPVLTTVGIGFPFGVAMSLTSQFVGQRWPLPMLKGSPEVCRYVPLICQPPTNASSTRFMPLPNFLPRPNGCWYTMYALTECVVS